MTEPRLVGERYELDGVVGRGGMAEVYRGHDRRLDRQVAIKALRADLAHDATFQERFRREAQSAASLNHPAIAAIYDTGEGELGGSTVPYIVMEYVAGRTLREMLRDDRQLLPERGLEIVDGVLRALEYSHRNGIVHRDIKPANVMITTSREVKVMDFGIARALHDVSSTMTQTAQVVGTAQYLSPEQARGERVDARTDIYSTGCVLYEILTGRPPFTGDSPVAIAYQHVREEPVPPSQVNPDVPEWADALVARAMTKDADDRYQSAAEMQADIQRVLAGERLAVPAGATATQQLGGTMAMGGTTQTLSPYPDETAERGRRRRSPWVIIPLVLLFLALAGLGGWFLTRGLREPETTRVNVPRVVGLDLQAAKNRLQKANLKAEVTRRFSDEEPAGTVFRQDPRATRSVVEGSTVTLVVSKGRDEVDVPTGLVGTARNEAAATLQDAGLEVGEVTRRASNAPPGEVLATRPTAGTSVPRGSSVGLVVSGGPAMATVPDVVGQGRGSAYAQLRRRGFQVNVTYQTTTVAPQGTVIDQSPDGGTSVEKGSAVTIVVAEEPDVPEPTPTPTPTTPSSPTPSETSSEEDEDGLLG